MTVNKKAFLEKISSDEELFKKLQDLKEAPEIIEFAKSLGFDLSEDDFKNEPAEMSLDELDAASGGGKCACVAAGAGKAGNKDALCVCPLAGAGMDKDKKNGRCVCAVGGVGHTLD